MLFDWFIYKFLKFSKKLPPISSELDADVKEEMDKIRNMTRDGVNNGNLVLNGLTKFYGNHLAVNQLHLSVGAAECFGLLGINVRHHIIYLCKFLIQFPIFFQGAGNRHLN